MKKTDKQSHKILGTPPIALVVGGNSSAIGKCIAHDLSDTLGFTTITPNKEAGETCQLDLLDITSVHRFVKEYAKKYPTTPLEVLFLNSGIMNKGDTIARGNLFNRFNNGDKDINLHLHNVLLVQDLHKCGIVTEKTKIIYNASIQIFVPKEGTEDYAFLKNTTATLLLGDKNLDVTILCLSLIKDTKMTNEFATTLTAQGKTLETFVKENMPYGQPTLDDVTTVTNQILRNKQETKGKFVCVDGGLLRHKMGENMPENCLYLDQEYGILLPYNEIT